MKIYRIAKKDREYLTPEEREEVKKRFKDIQCSFLKDKDGYYCHTHRARSKSYPSISDIPQSAVDFINSTSAAKIDIHKTSARPRGSSPIGTPMGIVGNEPIDNATRFGDLQQKIFDMLNDESNISKEDRDWLIRIYNAYQSGQKMSRKMAMIVIHIWQKYMETKSQTKEASNLNWYKTAVADGEFRDLKDRVNSIKDEMRDIKKDHKDFESRIKKIEKTLDDLNIGNRRFWQMTNVFTSLQRKVERFDVLEQEWKKFKEEMDDEIKKTIEKKFKAQIK